MEPLASKGSARKTPSPFQPRHELRYGVRVVEKDAQGVVCSLECQFCRCFGREGICPKRKRTQRIKYYKPPYRTQYYVQHNQVAHATKWAAYQALDERQKLLFFPDCPPSKQEQQEDVAPSPKRPTPSVGARPGWNETEMSVLLEGWATELRMPVLELDTTDAELGVGAEDAHVYRRFVAGMGGISRRSVEELAQKKTALRVTCAFIRAYNKGHFPTRGCEGDWDWFALPAGDRREAKKRATNSEAWSQVDDMEPAVFEALDAFLPAEEESLGTAIVFSALSRAMDEPVTENRAMQPTVTATATATTAATAMAMTMAAPSDEEQAEPQSTTPKIATPATEAVAHLMKQQHQELLAFLGGLKAELKADMLAERAREREHDAKEREAERQLHTQEREKDRALLRETFEMFLQQNSRK